LEPPVAECRGDSVPVTPPPPVPPPLWRVARAWASPRDRAGVVEDDDCSVDCFSLRILVRQTTQRRGRTRWATAVWIVLTKQSLQTTRCPHGWVCIVAFADIQITHCNNTSSSPVINCINCYHCLQRHWQDVLQCTCYNNKRRWCITAVAL